MWRILIVKAVRSHIPIQATHFVLNTAIIPGASQVVCAIQPQSIVVGNLSSFLQDGGRSNERYVQHFVSNYKYHFLQLIFL